MFPDMEMDHDAAMDLIHGAATVTSLSYEEAIAVYLRARGMLKEPTPPSTLAAPIPKGWRPPLAATAPVPVVDRAPPARETPPAPYLRPTWWET